MNVEREPLGKREHSEGGKVIRKSEGEEIKSECITYMSEMVKFNLIH